jgi:hypothetical protein
MKKKYFQLFVLMPLLSIFIFSGCASMEVNRYLYEIYPPNTKEIKIHSITLPKEPFIELAEITEDPKDIYKLKEEAAKLGADAIIIIGPAYIKNTYTGSFWNWTKDTKAKGYKAIAIKYTDNVTKK